MTPSIQSGSLRGVPALVVHTMCRKEAQRAVAPTQLRDVLLSLQKNRVIVRFRLKPKTVVIEAERVLGFFFAEGPRDS